jgi:monoamine oxidase
MFDDVFQTVGDLWNDAMKSVVYTSYEDLKAKYDKYSIEGYFLEHQNMSRGAIDFISLMYNVDMQTSLIEMVRSTAILTLNPEYTQIDGGFDLLIDKFENDCKNVPDGRCSIYTNTQVREVHYVEDPNNSSIRPWVRLVIGENSTAMQFDSIIVSTTARAANLIEFKPRNLFIDKYRVFRQLHYDCATKIAHSFSRQFWRDENIQGGYSITDLPIRFIFYNNFNTTADSASDGAFILTSYVWATDALLWSALGKEQACEKSLQDLIQLHNRSDIRSLVVSCEVKNWCTDQYAHGAYALFTPNQETNLHDELGKSIKNIVHFSGEHISYVHRWIEGAIQSSMRVLMYYQVSA